MPTRCHRFLADDDIFNSDTVCPNCIQYQADIQLLQGKLMEKHNKLIDQIDLCREQEIKIIKISQKGISRKSSKKLLQNKQESNIQEIVEERTQLLRNSLEAMRVKVMSEIQKSSKLKQKNKQMSSKYNRQVQELKQSIEILKQNNILLQSQLQNSKCKINKSSKINECSCGFEQKYYDLDKAFMNQRLITNQLIQQNAKIQVMLHGGKGTNSSQVKSQVKDSQIRSEARTQTQSKTRKKIDGFEETKSLIRQLEEAQKQIRNKCDQQKQNIEQ